MDAYTAFDPRMGDIAEPFFTKGWIDHNYPVEAYKVEAK